MGRDLREAPGLDRRGEHRGQPPRVPRAPPEHPRARGVHRRGHPLRGDALPERLRRRHLRRHPKQAGHHPRDQGRQGPRAHVQQQRRVLVPGPGRALRALRRVLQAGRPLRQMALRGEHRRGPLRQGPLRLRLRPRPLRPICQEDGLVPIVEPEILLDGEHDIDTTLEIASKTWAQVFKCLADQDVMFEGILLKPSMVTPGADSGTKLAPEVIADYTLKMLNRRVPPAVPGIMFLSGGQSEMESTLNLNAMNQTPNPWHVSFSYASRRTRRPPRTPSWCAPRPTRPRSSASTTPPASPPRPRR